MLDPLTRRQIDTLTRAVAALLRQAEAAASWDDALAFRTLRSQLEQIQAEREEQQRERRYADEDEP
ncbi:MAG: hypothetical protein IRY97_09390 [Thermomicrobiaceae bacterium]|nr:hypothetical protein [Thermomicrobiaceae bacterium]